MRTVSPACGSPQWVGIVLAALLCGIAIPAQAQTSETLTGNAEQTIVQWKASNATCRGQPVPALAAVAACEQRDTFSKLLAQMSYCYGPTDNAGPATWSPCDAAKAAQDSALARTTTRFHRMGGVFVLSAAINGSAKAYFVVDSGAANVQIPQEVADEMKRNGTLTDADFLGQRRFLLADGTGLQQRVFRLRTLQIGGRTMENVLAAVGAPRSRALLGQSFLRRLNWWKIDNVKNAIELEFTGSFHEPDWK
ncbi:retropepsin-like aspartic protease [Vineibacter terrae]|uniref:retropepsin-like aspartic protease family protein n=1 Tax=Vineibacter terrae TaxID=2586908 RepID=UPI002E381AC8|nr:retropepsin-like aspartic protease [Vineibacter terrae]HEX2892253.1 retropepsin-like aspartic protease [Vineibacter terrae]